MSLRPQAIRFEETVGATMTIGATLLYGVVDHLRPAPKLKAE